MSEPSSLRITPATHVDVPLILEFIRELAHYERLSDAVVATEPLIKDALFGPTPVAHAVIARVGEVPVGFALYFFNFSTFIGRAGLYLEDLFVRSDWRGRGIGRALLAHVAHIAVERGCGRMEWAVLDWNERALRVYRAIGAVPMDGWTVQRLSGEPLVALASQARG
jgi:GNAT superfamily N-acetyltransferase